MFETFHRLGLALGLGLLVGLQRQRTDARLAGFRTFPLVALLGALCGLLATSYGLWMVPGGLAAVALVIVGGNLPLLRVDSSVESPGVTTEMAMLVMFALGSGRPLGAASRVLARGSRLHVHGGGGLGVSHLGTAVTRDGPPGQPNSAQHLPTAAECHQHFGNRLRTENREPSTRSRQRPHENNSHTG